MSGRKNTLTPFKVITAGDMSGNLTSLVTNIQYLDNIGVQLIFTGTPTGTFTVEVSMNQIDWADITLSPPAVAAGAADNVYIDLNQLSAPYIRIVYTASSGSGTLDCYVTGKMV